MKNKPGLTEKSPHKQIKIDQAWERLRWGRREGGRGRSRTHNGLISLFQSDPVLAIGADVYSVSLDVIFLLGFLGYGTLCPHSRDESQEAQVHLQENDAWGQSAALTSMAMTSAAYPASSAWGFSFIGISKVRCDVKGLIFPATP